MSRQTVTVLREALASLADPARWWKTGMPEGCGDACVSLAISRAVNMRSAPKKEEIALNRAAHIALIIAAEIEMMSADWMEPVFRWNDAPERTHEEVLAALRKAIAAEEADDA